MSVHLLDLSCYASVHHLYQFDTSHWVLLQIPEDAMWVIFEAGRWSDTHRDVYYVLSIYMYTCTPWFNNYVLQSSLIVNISLLYSYCTPSHPGWWSSSSGEQVYLILWICQRSGRNLALWKLGYHLQPCMEQQWWYCSLPTDGLCWQRLEGYHIQFFGRQWSSSCSVPLLLIELWMDHPVFQFLGLHL